MRRLAPFLALALVLAADLAWAASSFSRYETGVATTRAAPTDAGEGVPVQSPGGLYAVTTACSAMVCAEPGVTIQGGPLAFWQYGPANTWSPSPSLDVVLPDAGTRCATAEPVPITYTHGLMLWQPKGLSLGGATDGGNTVSIYYQCLTDGPGAQPPRPQSTAVTVGNLAEDSANRPYVLPIQALCSAYAQTVQAVSDAGVSVPNSAQPGRRGVTICNSTENTGAPKLKCLVNPDAGQPAMGLTQPGDVLAVGDCATYPVDSTVPVKCVSDTANTAAAATECMP
jgi:hypothetical protein